MAKWLGNRMMYYCSAWQVNKNRVVLLRSGSRFPNALGGFFIMKMDDLQPAAAVARTLTVTSGVCDPHLCSALALSPWCVSHVACIVM